MSDQSKQEPEGVLRPDWFYSTAGICKALPIGSHVIAELIKQRRLEPTKLGRGYGFMGHEIIAALRNGK
jgi:hypothetical protein